MIYKSLLFVPLLGLLAASENSLKTENCQSETSEKEDSCSSGSSNSPRSMMSLKSALVLGATGETGREVLNKLVATPAIGRIVTIGRRIIDLPQEEPFSRVEQKIVNYDNLDDHAGDFAGVDMAYCCLGTTRGKAGKEGFIKVDHDYVVNSAKMLKSAGCPDFHLLTSKGSNVNSWFLYPETKGRAEASVRDLGFDRLNIYRPGFLKCDRTESRPAERAIRWLADKIDGSHSWSVPTSMVAAAMVDNSLVPSTAEILEHHHIVAVAQK